MADQSNRFSKVLGQGAFLRLLFRVSHVDTSLSLVVLPASNMLYDNFPNEMLMTEATGKGECYGMGTESHSIRVDLRRRRDPVSVDALGIRTNYFDAVVMDIGNTGYCHVIRGMWRGPYSLGTQQLQHSREMFSLRGGWMYARNVAIPVWAQAAVDLPLTGGYTRYGISFPSGF